MQILEAQRRHEEDVAEEAHAADNIHNNACDGEAQHGARLLIETNHAQILRQCCDAT